MKRGVFWLSLGLCQHHAVHAFIFAPVFQRSCPVTRRSSAAAVTTEQGFGGGIQLPAKDEANEYAKFLAAAVQLHLDQEWLPQDCHEQIGAEVARIYIETTVDGGNTDLNQLVMDVGTGLESFDMGDAFVGGWDVANLVSDFMIAQMGLETAACSAKVPEGVGTQKASTPDTVTCTTDEAADLAHSLDSEFARYRWLGGFMDETVSWEDANRVMALRLGYKVGVAGRFDDTDVATVWRSRGAAGPPDFCTEDTAIEIAEAQLPQHPDDQEAMEDFLEVLYGEEAKKMADADENAVDYRRRATVFKWLYNDDFLKTKLIASSS